MIDESPHTIKELREQAKMLVYKLPDCQICLEPLQSELVSLPCGHLFHAQCMKENQMHRKECCFCKMAYRAQDVRELYFEAEKKARFVLGSKQALSDPEIKHAIETFDEKMRKNRIYQKYELLKERYITLRKNHHRLSEEHHNALERIEFLEYELEGLGDIDMDDYEDSPDYSSEQSDWMDSIKEEESENEEDSQSEQSSENQQAMKAEAESSQQMGQESKDWINQIQKRETQLNKILGIESKPNQVQQKPQQKNNNSSMVDEKDQSNSENSSQDDQSSDSSDQSSHSMSQEDSNSSSQQESLSQSASVQEDSESHHICPDCQEKINNLENQSDSQQQSQSLSQNSSQNQNLPPSKSTPVKPTSNFTPFFQHFEKIELTQKKSYEDLTLELDTKTKLLVKLKESSLQFEIQATVKIEQSTQTIKKHQRKIQQLEETVENLKQQILEITQSNKALDTSALINWKRTEKNIRSMEYDDENLLQKSWTSTSLKSQKFSLAKTQEPSLGTKSALNQSKKFGQVKKAKKIKKQQTKKRDWTAVTQRNRRIIPRVRILRKRLSQAR